MKLQKDKIPKTAYVKICYTNCVILHMMIADVCCSKFQVLVQYFWFKEFLLMWCNCHGNLDKLGACDRYQC
jgi:hypothetical protein